MAVEAIPASELAEILEKMGKSPEEIAATTGIYSEKKYTPKKKLIKTTLEVLSDRTVTLGNEEHTLRKMNGADVARSIGVLVNVISELWNLGELPTELPEDLGEALEKTGPLDWVDFLQRYLLDNMPVDDEYPEWMASLLEEIAKLVSTEARAVSAGDLVSLPLGQLPDVITAMVEVNKKDFLFIILRVWGMLPQYIRQFAKQRIFTPALKITSVLKRINQAPQNPRDPVSDGGHPSGGKASSSSPSETVDTTPTQSLSLSA